MPAFKSLSADLDAHLWVTILAGGSGTRFWPASTPRRPKQLLPLTGDAPLIRETLDRARSLVPDERIRILTGSHLLEPFRDALGELDPSCFLVEPEARGTAPVLTWAAWEISRRDPEAVLVSLHADHAIEPLEAFLNLMRHGATAALAGDALYTVAVPPDRPETGYGYIQPGKPISSEHGTEIVEVRSFVEKPDERTAGEYVRAGFLWNSGIFLWRASTFLEEVREVAPELGNHLPLLEQGDVESFFLQAPKTSVDEAVLERSTRVRSLKATFRWDDVGSWQALGRTRSPDADGNVFLGEVHGLGARDNIVMAQEGTVVLLGARDLVVVRSGDVVFVAPRDRTPEMKSLLEILPPELRDPDP